MERYFYNNVIILFFFPDSPYFDFVYIFLNIILIEKKLFYGVLFFVYSMYIFTFKLIRIRKCFISMNGS